MNQFFNNILTFTTINAPLCALLILASLYALISLGILMGMAIRRRTKRWRQETVQDIIKFKFFSISYMVASLLSMIFLPYIAVPLWIGCYRLLEKKLCMRDMLAMAHFDARSLYEKHPMQVLKAYRAQMKAQNITDKGKGIYPWALEIYIYLAWIMAVPFLTAMLSETTRVMHDAPGIININIAAVCLFVSVYIIFCWGKLSKPDTSVIVPIPVFLVVMVLLNLLMLGVI